MSLLHMQTVSLLTFIQAEMIGATHVTCHGNFFRIRDDAVEQWRPESSRKEWVTLYSDSLSIKELQSNRMYLQLCMIENEFPQLANHCADILHSESALHEPDTCIELFELALTTAKDLAL